MISGFAPKTVKLRLVDTEEARSIQASKVQHSCRLCELCTERLNGKTPHFLAEIDAAERESPHCKPQY